MELLEEQEINLFFSFACVKPLRLVLFITEAVNLPQLIKIAYQALR